MVVVLLVLLTVAKAQHGELNLTLRSQHMSTIGRQEWLVQNQGVSWTAASTAFVIVDMWDKHWCPSATTRVAELATPMNQFVKAARLLGAHIVWAPSDVTGFYPPTNCTARNNTLSLEHNPLAHTRNVTIPQFPLSSATDGGCDTQAPMYGAWQRQIATLEIADTDYLIAAGLPGNPNAGTQELWNVIGSQQIQHLVYMGVHENMCIMGRPFAIEMMTRLGFEPSDIAVVKQLVDVSYTPKDPPYVSHAAGLELHTDYIEKFWGSSMSMYDVLVSSY